MCNGHKYKMGLILLQLKEKNPIKSYEKKSMKYEDTHNTIANLQGETKDTHTEGISLQ